MTKAYISQRGVKSTTIPMQQISLENRVSILEDYLTIGSAATREKWNISVRVLHHIRWHNKQTEQQLEDKHFQRFGL